MVTSSSSIQFVGNPTNPTNNLYSTSSCMNCYKAATITIHMTSPTLVISMDICWPQPVTYNSSLIPSPDISP
jgi:hypothetical protein